MDGPAIISVRADNILAIILMVLAIVTVIVIPAQIWQHVKAAQGGAQ